MATGWTWEYVWETMTLHRLEVMNRLWKKCPPPHLSLAYIKALLKAFMGVKDDDAPANGPARLPAFATLPDIEE